MSIDISCILLYIIVIASKTETSLAEIGLDSELIVSYSPAPNSSPTMKKGYNRFPLSNSGLASTYGVRSVDFTSDVIFTSICSDYTSNSLYLHEYFSSTIYIESNHSYEIKRTWTAFHRGPGSIYTRIAFDWLSNSLYWTDPTYGWIGVKRTTNIDSTVYRILVYENIQKPHGIGLDPFQGYLFWTDIGRVVTMERSTLSGDDRKVLISSGLIMPTSMVADIRTEKIFWIDEARDTVESAMYDGSGRKVIRRIAHAVFFSIEVFQELVYVSSIRYSVVIIMDKNNGGTNTTLLETNHDPRGISIYHPEAHQNGSTDHCGILQCGHICISRPDNAVCICKEGFTLNPDGKTCSEDTRIFHRGLVMSNSTSICFADIHAITSRGYPSSCFIITLGITHFELDNSRREIIFANSSGLYYTSIDQHSVNRLYAVSGKISGLSFDWTDRSIYWSEEDTGIIAFVSRVTSISLTILSKLDSPKHVLALPLEGRILWVSGIYLCRIESSKFDGSDRKTVVEFSSSSRPSAISFDSSTQRLYFLDNNYIASCYLNGSDVKKNTTAPANTEMLHVYKGYLLLHYQSSSSLYSTIKSFAINGLSLLEEIPSQFQSIGKITDLKVFDDRLQPIRKGPCDELNGGCEQICIPTGLVNRACLCKFGFRPDTPNGYTCSSSPVYRNFLLVSDWTHDMIYQLSLNTYDVQALDIKKIKDPAGVAYDYRTGTVVWGSSAENEIFTVGINGSAESFLFQTGDMYNAYPERFTIDFSTGNIYYTAYSINRKTNPTDSYIAVLSTIGLHKRLITGLDSPRAIVLYPSKGIMFWTDFGSNPHIGRSNMDGQNSTIFIYTAVKFPGGLAIDYSADRLYWSDSYTDRIESSKLDGSDRKVVFVDFDAFLMDIILDNAGNLYYTAWNRQYITKLTLSRPNQTERLFEKPELGRMDALAIYTIDNQPVNVMCSYNNGQCSTFCLPTPQGRTCACEGDVPLREDGKICSNVITTTKTSTVIPTSKTTSFIVSSGSKGTTEVVPPPTVTTTSSRPTVALPVQSDQTWIFSVIGGSAGLVVLTIAVVLTICCCRRRKYAKHIERRCSERILSSRDGDVPSHSTELHSNRSEAQCAESRPVSTASNIYFTIEETLHKYEEEYLTPRFQNSSVEEIHTNSRTQESDPVHNHPAPKDDWKSQNSDYETLIRSVQNTSPKIVDIPKDRDSAYETPVTSAGNNYVEMPADIPKLPSWRGAKFARIDGDLGQLDYNVVKTSHTPSVDFQNIAFTQEQFDNTAPLEQV